MEASERGFTCLQPLPSASTTAWALPQIIVMRAPVPGAEKLAHCCSGGFLSGGGMLGRQTGTGEGGRRVLSPEEQRLQLS